jgi:hypothetical protein
MFPYPVKVRNFLIAMSRILVFLKYIFHFSLLFNFYKVLCLLTQIRRIF